MKKTWCLFFSASLVSLFITPSFEAEGAMSMEDTVWRVIIFTGDGGEVTTFRFKDGFFFHENSSPFPYEEEVGIIRTRWWTESRCFTGRRVGNMIQGVEILPYAGCDLPLAIYPFFGRLVISAAPPLSKSTSDEEMTPRSRHRVARHEKLATSWARIKAQR